MSGEDERRNKKGSIIEMQNNTESLNRVLDILESSDEEIDTSDTLTEMNKNLFILSNRLDKSPALQEDIDKLNQILPKYDRKAKLRDAFWKYGYFILILLFMCLSMVPGLYTIIFAVIFIYCVGDNMRKVVEAADILGNKGKTADPEKEYSFLNYPKLTKRRQLYNLTTKLLSVFKNGYLKVDSGIDTSEFERVGLILKDKEFYPNAKNKTPIGSIWFGMKTDKIEFELSNMEIRYSVNGTSKTSFLGVLSKVHLNQPVTEDTIIIPRSSERWVTLGAWEFDEKINIPTSNDLFNKCYRVQSSTGDTSVNINLKFMDSLIQVSKKYPNIGFATSENELFIAWRTDDVFFPVELDRTGEIDRLIEFAKDVIRMKELFEANINTFNY